MEGMKSQRSQDHLNSKFQSNFRVVIRVRPFLPQELRLNTNLLQIKKNNEQAGLASVDCLDIDLDTNQRISLVRHDYDPRDYYFDHVLNSNSSQNEAYEQIARPVV